MNDMKDLLHLLDIQPADYFPNSNNSLEHIVVRNTAKGIVYDNQGKIALVGLKYPSLPGGGVEDGETFEQAFLRECKEEIGCAVEIVGTVGTINQYRTDECIDHHNISQMYHVVCFTAKVVGEKHEPTEQHLYEKQIIIHWFFVEEAINFLQKQLVELLDRSDFRVAPIFNTKMAIEFLKNSK